MLTETFSAIFKHRELEDHTEKVRERGLTSPQTKTPLLLSTGYIHTARFCPIYKHKWQESQLCHKWRVLSTENTNTNCFSKLNKTNSFWARKKEQFLARKGKFSMNACTLYLRRSYIQRSDWSRTSSPIIIYFPVSFIFVCDSDGALFQTQRLLFPFFFLFDFSKKWLEETSVSHCVSHAQVLLKRKLR